MSEHHEKFKAVLFDLDGTLIEFKFPVRESRFAMFDFLRINGYKVEHLKDNMRTQDLIDEADSQWSGSEKLKDLHTFTDLRESLFRILDDFEFESIKSSKPVLGCRNTLQKINEIGLTMGMVTNSGRAPVISILSDYGFLPYMEVVVTRNEMTRMKPSPDGLLEAARLLQLEPRDILYVGDSVLDIEAASKAGMKCASIPAGYYSTEALRKMSPDFIFETIQDLENILVSNRS